jgi:hypothetical protein
MAGGLLQVELQTPRIGKRPLARIHEAANRSAMLAHVLTNLRKHFEDNPLTRPGGPYGFKARTRKYLKRKLAATGSTAPNVYTGRMREIVLANPEAKITATQHRSRFVAPGALHFPLSPARRRQYLAEMEVVTEFERGNLGRLQAARVREGISAHIQNDRRRTKSG